MPVSTSVMKNPHKDKTRDCSGEILKKLNRKTTTASLVPIPPDHMGIKPAAFAKGYITRNIWKGISISRDNAIM